MASKFHVKEKRKHHIFIAGKEAVHVNNNRWSGQSERMLRCFLLALHFRTLQYWHIPVPIMGAEYASGPMSLARDSSDDNIIHIT